MNQKEKMLRFMVLIMSCVTLVMGFVIKGDGNTSYISAAALKTPTLTIVSRTPSSVNVKYTKVTGATGYQIYRTTSKDGKYTKVKTTKELTFKDTGITNTKAYYYKVRAYKKGAKSNTYSSFSKIGTVQPILGKVQNVTAKSNSGEIQLTWNTVSKAANYRIYRAASKNGTYHYLDSSTNKNFKDTSVTAGKTYYYKVRAYAVMQSVKYYGAYSAVVSAKAADITVTPSPTPDQNQSQNSYEQQVIDLINKERNANGLSPVTTTTTLQNAAYKRAVEIKELFSHTRPDGTSCFTVLGEFQISYTACGENIAYGQKTPEAVMQAWMNSSGHRANILSSKFGKVGIGYYVVNGTPYWVQLFTN